MQKDVRSKRYHMIIKAAALSFFTAFLLTLVSLLFKEQSSCCADCMCIAGPVSYRGYPFQYLTNSFGLYGDTLKGFVANLVTYFMPSFIIFFVVLKVLSAKRRQNSQT